MIDKDTLLWSSGWWGRSKLVTVKFDLDTCSFKEIQSEALPKKYFAEGATLTNENKIFQLTYKTQEVFVWDLIKSTVDGKLNYNIKSTGVLPMPKGNTLKEGWGLAYRHNIAENSHLLYATDGSA